MAQSLEVTVARIIDPVAMRKFDVAVSEGRMAANGKPWAEVAYGSGREAALQQARAAIAAIQGKWRPIETAPRDGSMILALNAAHREMCVVGWQPGDDEEADHWDNVGVRNAAPAIYLNANYFQFWQPLPALPPESAVKNGDQS